MRKLYKISVEHVGPKDSHTAVETFILAENDEEVYLWLDKEKCCGGWSENENVIHEIYNDNFEIIGQETYKEKIIRLKGELNDDDRDCGDSYYGLNFYGWEQMKVDVNKILIVTLESLGMLVTV